MLNEKSKFKKFMTWDTSNLGILEKNEVLANRTVAISLFNTSIFFMLMLILAGILLANNFQNITRETLFYSLGTASIVSLFISLIGFIRKGRGKWLKYVLLIGLLFTYLIVFTITSSLVVIGIIIPLILSCRYYDKKLVVFISFLTIIAYLIGICLSAVFGYIDFNGVRLGTAVHVNFDFLSITNLYKALIDGGVTTGQLIGSLLLNIGIPGSVIIALIALICYLSARRGDAIAYEMLDITTQSTRIESELSIATSIQANMLPNIFPPFPTHKEFDLFAKMTPAKEVGGDFYDFFMIDDTHLCLVIADVSGKGVPASLFMAITKTLIKDHAQLRLEPSEIFIRVNKILCDGNKVGLFVTSWLGIIDLTNGEINYVNAGHNPPVFIHGPNNEVSLLKGKRGIVLGAFDTAVYSQDQIKIDVNDKLFLYTDGITEATNKNQQLYGENRLLTFMKTHTSDTSMEIIDDLRADIDKFVDGAEQFDDMTTVAFKLNSFAEIDKNEKVFIADNKNLDVANEFMEEKFGDAVDPKLKMQMSVVLEEVFANISNYAYPTKNGIVKLAVNVEDDTIIMRIKDSGIPFNPLDKIDPNINLGADERQIGGLGIFMVKKMMDTVKYEYIDGMNVLTLTKKIVKEK